MTLFRISYVVDGLNDVLDTATKEVKVDEVTFQIRKKENVGTISLETNNDSVSANVEKEALYLIDKALSELCFAYNTVAQIKSDSLYICNLTHDPNHETVQGSFVLRWGYLREEPEQTLSKIALIPKEKKAVLDLALAYYKLSYYRNPVRIQTLFSCISVIIRNLIGNDYLKTPELKNRIRSILIHQNPNLDQTEFEKNWNDCYSIERNYIAHGKESRLVDITNLRDHDRLVGIVGSWARQIIYYYINSFQAR